MQTKYPEVHIYIGPTLFGFADKLIHGDEKIIWHTPVKRHDIEKLACTGTASVIAIVDGNFHNCLSVGHVEIREAVKNGWKIWGLSSMGAIRAAEMGALGVRGFGKVFERYQTDDDFADDEVAMLHAEKKPYSPVTEPLIHIRYAMEYLKNESLITAAQADKIINALSQMWYGERTLQLLAGLLKSQTSFNAEGEVLSFIKGFDRFRIKSLDFISFYNKKAWMSN